MADETMYEELARLRARVSSLEVERARRQRPRRRVARVLLPAAITALLVALVPLGLLAANPFTDLNPGSVHNANIDAIYNAGVTTGCVPNQEYCPNRNVTREEMASFLARLGGLGSNPPVANAKTALTATDATTVGGLAPNGLVRVARGANPTLVGLNALSYTTLATVNITAPGAGFVLVTGGTIVQGTGAASVRLRNAASATDVSPILGVAVDSGTADGSATPTWVFQVAAGPQSFVLEARASLSTDTLIAGGPTGQITALYVPFGSTGTSAFGSGEEPPPAPAPGSGPLLRP